MQVTTEYAGPSKITIQPDLVAFDFSADQRRPVRFHARITRNTYPLRLAFQALGELVWSSFQWMNDDEFEHHMEMVLDPVITVHEDRVFFEAFNQDLSAYGLVIVDREMFETTGLVQTGTTNIDFTQGLMRSLLSMRTSRETWFRVGPQGFQIETSGGAHHEAKVEVPSDWLEGFLQLQGAMAMPGTRLSVVPVDVLNILEYLRSNTAFQSPRSLRFEFEPGCDAKVVLEPWERIIELEGASHNYTQHKTTRIWGRRRLKLIEKLLPLATSVDVYLKGRALPSFWAVNMPGVTFVLGTSGWTGNNWTQGAAFDLLTGPAPGEAAVGAALAHLRRDVSTTPSELAADIGVTVPEARRALSETCRRGQSIYDLTQGRFRHRELFESPIDSAALFTPNPRRIAAAEFVDRGLVNITSSRTRETQKARGRDPVSGEEIFKVYVDQVFDAAVDDQTTHVVLKADGSIIFGRCTCEFFDKNLMNLGPCEHMLAVTYLDSTGLINDHEIGE